jgi:hypothetical protein
MEIHEITGRHRKILTPLHELRRMYRSLVKQLDSWESQLRDDPSSFRPLERQINAFVEKKFVTLSSLWFNPAARLRKSPVAWMAFATVRVRP